VEHQVQATPLSLRGKRQPVASVIAVVFEWQIVVEDCTLRGSDLLELDLELAKNGSLLTAAISQNELFACLALDGAGAPGEGAHFRHVVCHAYGDGAADGVGVGDSGPSVDPTFQFEP
jgi:hypothetical protein